MSFTYNKDTPFNHVSDPLRGAEHRRQRRAVVRRHVGREARHGGADDLTGVATALQYNMIQ